MWRVMCLVGIACGDPKPGDVGYEDCQAYDPGVGLISCEQIDICCEQVSRTEVTCAYVTSDGTRYECLSEIDCNEAASDVICDVCSDASTGGSYDLCE